LSPAFSHVKFFNIHFFSPCRKKKPTVYGIILESKRATHAMRVAVHGISVKSDEKAKPLKKRECPEK